MLSDAYPFYFIQNVYDKNSDSKDYTSLFRFKSLKSNLAYIVEVEHYKHNVYAVKFYLKAHRNSQDKYRLLSNTFEPRKIIYTCINIMLTIYENDKKASFGFVGSNGLDEDIKATKRYRIYSKIIATYFTDEHFFHKENIDKSAYVLVNNITLQENPNLISDMEFFFQSEYAYFDV